MNVPTQEAPEALDSPCGRPMRADALRNRTRVLEAAEAVFATEGLSVPIDVIAERAGVGVGTLYRHFPTKEALFAAIVVSRFEKISCDARARLSDEDPGKAFYDFLDCIVQEGSSKRDFIVALAGEGIELEVVAAEAKRGLEETFAELLRRAQEAGAVRTDVGAVEVMSLVGGACLSSDKDHDASTRNRMLQIICDGLKTS
jgi:AcrR family transcriptional regulator